MQRRCFYHSQQLGTKTFTADVSDMCKSHVSNLSYPLIQDTEEIKRLERLDRQTTVIYGISNETLQLFRLVAKITTRFQPL
jgi:hypothetical protein